MWWTLNYKIKLSPNSVVKYYLWLDRFPLLLWLVFFYKYVMSVDMGITFRANHNIDYPKLWPQSRQDRVRTVYHTWVIKKEEGLLLYYESLSYNYPLLSD